MSAEPAPGELLELAKPYFKRHFELAPSAPEFVLNTTRGVHLLERALERARADRTPLQEYEALAMLGIYHSNMQRLAEALDLYEKARGVLDANPGLDWGRRAAMNYNNTSGVLRKMGRWKEVVEWLERSRAAFDAGGHAGNVLIADLYLGEAYREAGRLADSRAAYVRGLALAVEIEQRGEVPWLKWGLGETLAALGEKDAARAELERAEELLLQQQRVEDERVPGEAQRSRESLGAAGEAEAHHLAPLRRALWKLARERGDAAAAERYEKLVLSGTMELPRSGSGSEVARAPGEA